MKALLGISPNEKNISYSPQQDRKWVASHEQGIVGMRGPEERIHEGQEDRLEFTMTHGRRIFDGCTQILKQPTFPGQ